MTSPLTFATPLGLAALAALVVPLLIHLMRRSDERILPFAALRFLRERRHPRREWQVQRRVLLALRLLLIGCLALLLTSPAWYTSGAAQAPWLVLAPGVPAAAADTEAARTSAAAPTQAHWLTAGFPVLASSDEAPQATRGGVPLASLLRELDATLPQHTALTVVVPAELGGLDAERVRLGRAVDWRVVPGRSPTSSSSPSTPSSPTDGAPRSAAAAPMTIAVRYDSAGAAELPVARALAAAWSVAGMKLTLDVATAEVPVSNAAWLIWLGGPLPAAVADWVRGGGVALQSRAGQNNGETALTDAAGAVVLRERTLGNGRILSAAGPLAVATLPALLEPGIARQIQELLAAPLMPPDRAPAASVAPLRREAISQPTLSLAPYVAVCAAFLFLVERLWATRRAQRRESRR